MRTNKTISIVTKKSPKRRDFVLQTNRSNSRTSKSSEIFKRFTIWINHLTNFQFFLFILFVGLFSFFSFRTVRSLVRGDGIDGIIPKIQLDCNVDKNKIEDDCIELAPQLEQTDGLTNVLLVGIDTREKNDEGLMNTDTIMIASFDHNTGKTLLISLPRDLYHSFKINGRYGGTNKINSIYAIGETVRGTNGMDVLKENIEDWFGIKIHYTAKVNFSALTELINEIDGIDVELEKDYTDIFPYKDLIPEYQKNCKRDIDEPLYCIFTFKKGLNHLNGEDALIYSRMRYWSSDFDRARRQQQVIDAIKTKMLGDQENLYDKAMNAWNIYSMIVEKGYVVSNVSSSDIIPGLVALRKADLHPISVVLGPDLAHGTLLHDKMINQDENGENGISVLQLTDESFQMVRDEIAKIRMYPDLYRDRASVVVLNNSGTNIYGEKSAELKKLDPHFDYLIFKSGEIKDPDTQNQVRILVFNDKKTVSVDYLKNYFNTENVIFVTEEMPYKQSSTSREDIRVEINSEIS